SRADVERCGLSLGDCIGACEEALSAKTQGKIEMPPKLGISPRPGALFHAMPARLPDVAGMKWISVFPDRRPALTALIVLNDLETGAPVAIVEGAYLTALRTPAATAIAARRLAWPGVETIAVIGPGQQGRMHLAALKLVLPRLRRCRAWAPSRATAERYAAEMSREHGIEVEAADSAEAACRDAGVVVTCAPWPPRAAPSLGPRVFARGAFVCTIDYDASVGAAAAGAFDQRYTDDVSQMKLARRPRHLRSSRREPGAPAGPRTRPRYRSSGLTATRPTPTAPASPATDRRASRIPSREAAPSCDTPRTRRGPRCAPPKSGTIGSARDRRSR
ncbi:MAG: ornithine cyclodeaminase family protein, partial [Deltaproteobacteria bacterium]